MQCQTAVMRIFKPTRPVCALKKNVISDLCANEATLDGLHISPPCANPAPNFHFKKARLRCSVCVFVTILKVAHGNRSWSPNFSMAQESRAQRLSGARERVGETDPRRVFLQAA